MSRPNATSLNSTTVADLLERVLDKGVVIAGDIKVKLVDIELLSIQIRLVICSVDKAREMGMDWWVNHPVFSRQPERPALPEESATPNAPAASSIERKLEETLTRMGERLASIERAIAEGEQRGASPSGAPIVADATHTVAPVAATAPASVAPTAADSGPNPSGPAKPWAAPRRPA